MIVEAKLAQVTGSKFWNFLIAMVLRSKLITRKHFLSQIKGSVFVTIQTLIRLASLFARFLQTYVKTNDTGANMKKGRDLHKFLS